MDRTRFRVFFSVPLLLVASVWLTGCPEAKSPETTPTATVSAAASPEASTMRAPAALQGGWTPHLTSASPSLNPDMFPTPDAQAKVFFDHQTSVQDGEVVVEHGILDKTFRVGSGAPSRAIESLVLGIDWAKLGEVNDPPSEGGTEFTFVVTHGDANYRVVTTDLDAHPKLKELMELLKVGAGVP